MSTAELTVYGLDDDQFITLQPHCWYAWQMLPGYGADENEGYFSPIWISGVTPLKTGQGLMQLDFYNACYASGVRDFSLKLKVLCRRQQCLIVNLPDYRKPDQRDAVISKITLHWFQRHCPETWQQHPPEHMKNPLARSDFHYYLNEVFFRDLRPENAR